MKYNKFIKNSLFATILIFSGALFTACSDDVEVGRVDEGGYVTNKDALAYIVNGEGKRSVSTVDFREDGSTQLYLGLSKNAPQKVDATLKYDKSVLDEYIATYGSQYDLLPQDLVSFEGNGTVSLEAGQNKSHAISIGYKTSAALETGKTYVIPVKAEVKAGGVTLSDNSSNYLIFVKDFSKIPDVAKSTGIRIISCMEVNDTNPLNNLCFTLKNSGKPLIDVVILFSANINYNSETGQVYVFQNPQVTHILANRDKYIKPLQDRGMKVLLGILGNHDRSGIANLSDATARQFARELKAVCDAYRLDGVFFDDEYSSPISPPPPGFVIRSYLAASRLHYETHMIMPDRLVTTYVYGGTRYLNEVEGLLPGQYLDFGIHDYGGYWDLAVQAPGNPRANYPGMPRKNQALYSQEFSRGYGTSETNLKRLRDDGYGAHMIFAMDPNRSNFNSGWFTQKSAMESIAKVLFDDELVYDENPQPKEW